ncbi:MAG: TSUP family transporter, partial [Gammaproteobacteria bacterium]|nr:TSUP family transporter [Gammaproteobacteria bacterium]
FPELGLGGWYNRLGYWIVNALIQAMGMLFTLSTLALALALQSNDLLTVEHGTSSTIALLPAILGMLLGQRIRRMISESLFRKIFFVSLLAIGVYIIVTALGDSG